MTHVYELTKNVGWYSVLNIQDKCSEKTCNVYGVCLNTFTDENIYKKEALYKIFDSKITTFLLKLQAISFFAYKQTTTFVKAHDLEFI